MRSRVTWFLLLSLGVASTAACSSDGGGPSQSGTGQLQGGGAGGTGAAMMTPSMAPSTAMGGTAAAVPSTPAARPRENAVPAGINTQGRQNAGGSSRADAGAAADAGRVDAGRVDAGAGGSSANAGSSSADAGAPAPAAAEDAGAVLSFADIFPILVASCGGCHGANARGNLPRFADANDPTASFLATQGISMAAPVSERIVQRAVFQRSMPPNCRGGALGSMNCLSQADADALQAWLAQGANP